MKTSIKNYLLITFLLCLMVGCGGGSSSGNSVGEETDSEYPSASIAFPASDGLWSDKEQLVVRGSANDNVGVAKVSVNGVDATSDDDFATWQAEITLEEGTTTSINIEVTDVNGNTSPAAASVSVNSYDGFNSYRFCGPLAFDSDRNLAYTFNPTRVLNLESMREDYISSEFSDVVGAEFDQATGNFLIIQNDQLISVDREFNSLNIISESGDDSLSFGSRPQISIDVSSGDIYVQNYFPSYLIKVDPTTGEREKISSFNYEDGSSVGYFNQGFEIVDGRFFVVSEDGLLELNPVTWQATELSGTSVGSGESLQSLTGLTIDLEANLAYATDFHGKVLEIDLVSGNRKLLSSVFDTGSDNLDFDYARNGIIDTGKSILVNSCSTGHTFLVSKEDGSRILVSEKIRGEGPLLSTNTDLVYDEYNERLLLLNDNYAESRYSNFEYKKIDQIIAIYPQSGNREIISGPNKGEGLIEEYFHDLAVDKRNGDIYVIEPDSQSIVKVDPITGNRSIASGGDIGSGDAFNGVSGIAIDTLKDRILTVSGNYLTSVDLQSGNRTPIISFSTLDIWYPNHLSINESSTKIYISDTLGSVVEYDLENEVYGIISSNEIGTGESIHELSYIAYSSEDDLIFVEDYNHTESDDETINMELLAIDRETGNRTLLLNAVQQEWEDMLLTPAVDQANNILYISMPNRGVAVFDVETKQYLMISQ
ncbi:hypothetical protein ACJJIF_14850 [Microbulbifer sp. SSSA002]|uniref:hypothetical protein n=1 Tax=Microbulbifer sp. SSSA002 TaxID=3243376 RepID=UPI004039B0FD